MGLLVGAVGIELVGQSLSLAESTALTPLHPSKTPLEHRILATSWPRILLLKKLGSSGERIERRGTSVLCHVVRRAPHV